jgi:phosphoadenosine phosphosulfate reductase
LLSLVKKTNHNELPQRREFFKYVRIRRKEMRKAIEVSQRAAEEFGDGLYALTSFGNESALLPDILQKAGVETTFITVDTGFWFPETHNFKDELTTRYGLALEAYGPSEEDVDTVLDARLWEEDLDAYHEIVKHEPLRRAIDELGVTGLLAGVRAGQTATRATLSEVGQGNDGETRIHPLLGISEEQASEYFERHDLPRHPLYYQGYGSVGDWTTTTPGQGREGRELPGSECGLHLTTDGRLVRAVS